MNAVENGEHPKRVFKASGVNKRGERCEPYIKLNLHHHHLGRRNDPIIVFQKVGDNLYGINITTHADYINGRELKWLYVNRAAIEWRGCEDILGQVIALGS